MTVTLDQPLELPCGATLKNRLGKSAMSETLGTTDNRVTAKLTRLYRAWARGGTGLSVTGNVMIDRRALGEPCNVVLEDRRDMDRLKAWARAGRENGTHLWMQINHPGKQAPAALNRETVSPSAVPFSDPNLKRFFHVPRALTVAEIEDLVRRFGETAALAKEAGFPKDVLKMLDPKGGGGRPSQVAAGKKGGFFGKIARRMSKVENEVKL